MARVEHKFIFILNNGKNEWAKTTYYLMDKRLITKREMQILRNEVQCEL